MGIPAIDDLTRLMGKGPSSGVALSILAVGTAILIIALKAIPVYKGWTQAILEFRGNQLRQSARLHALTEQTETTEGRLLALAAELARLEDHLAALKAEVSQLGSDRDRDDRPPLPGEPGTSQPGQGIDHHDRPSLPG